MSDDVFNYFCWQQFIPGMVVVVRAYGGVELTRRVVVDLAKTVVVCTEEEYRRAQKDRREPDGIGFPPLLRTAESLVSFNQFGVDSFVGRPPLRSLRMAAILRK